MPALTMEVRNHVAHLTLNRPEAANALNGEMARELEQASLQCEEDPAVRAVLLTGAGKLFCGGGDLKEFGALPADQLSGFLKTLTMYFHRAIHRFALMKAPLIVAVNGNAGGGGMSLALAGDIVMAGESARFTVAYTRIGLTPDGCLTYNLPRLIGYRRATELMLTNRTVTAREAEAIGMITKVVPDADLMNQAAALAAELANGPTRAFGGVKRLLFASANNPMGEQMELESEWIGDMGATVDGFGGIKAFLAKQPPKYSGQ